MTPHLPKKMAAPLDISVLLAAPLSLLVVMGVFGPRSLFGFVGVQVHSGPAENELPAQREKSAVGQCFVVVKMWFASVRKRRWSWEPARGTSCARISGDALSGLVRGSRVARAVLLEYRLP